MKNVTAAGAKKNRASNVKVVVRVRPTNFQEKEGGFKSVVKVIDEYMLVFDPKCDSEAVRFGRAPPKTKTRSRGTILDRRVKDLRFAFDRVFDERATNQEVFENTTSSVIDSVLEGFNCSVFAYGATSAGKTHTMLGSPKQPGVIYLTMVELYQKILERKDEFSCEVSVSYLEIYNETARDLLLPTTVSLAVREDPQKGVCVTGLSLHKPKSAKEILGMLEFGNQNRTQHPTDANKQSSRSHAVFQVFVRQQPKSSGLSTDVKLAKMSLIDLAGSERATVTTNRGARFREGANINRSLLALGNCINALAENKTVKGKKEVHIPYRDSKLTRLLKDSLGGNCKTIMIAALSPSSQCYEDTYNTLKYANRAKEIKSTLTSNVISVDFHVTKYAKIVEELKQQVEDLKSKMTRYESGEATPMRQQKLRCTQKDQLIVIQDELCGIYKSRCLIRKQIIDCEAAEKELRIKIFKRERNIERIQLVRESNDNAIEESIRKLDRFRSATKIKQTQLTEKTQSLVKQLAGNDEKIAVTKSRADEWLSTVVDESLKDSFIMFQGARVLEVEKVSARAQTRHLRRYLLMQEKDSQSTERLVSTLLGLVYKQHNKLQSTSMITAELSQDFESLLNDLEGSRRITWADESTRENLDGTSLMNFSSCTPIQTPARKKSVLQTETPKKAGWSSNAINVARNLDSIAAMNSLLNSKSVCLNDEDVAQGGIESMTNKADGIITENMVTDSEDQFVDDIKAGNTEHCTSSVDVCLSQSVTVGQPILPSIETVSSSPLQASALLPRRRALVLESDGASEKKISRFDESMLPDIPANEDLERLAVNEAKAQAQNGSVCVSDHSATIKSVLTSADHATDKDRRGTMVINKNADELKSLPIIESCSLVHEGSAAVLSRSVHGVLSSAISNEGYVLNNEVTNIGQRESLPLANDVLGIDAVQAGSSMIRNEPPVSNGLIGTSEKVDHLPDACSTTKGDSCVGNLQSDDAMNVTFDVNENPGICVETETSLESTFVLSAAIKKPDLDLSGVEPLVESPRQPLADICKNKLNGSMLTQQAASLHHHGLPSMRDNSNFKIKPQITCNNKGPTESTKLDAKDHKSPYGSAKAAKSKYATVSSRLYDENPRYASATIANRMKARSDKKRRSNTLSNPIRLRETRRRSRTTSAMAPYNIATSKRHTPGHMLGIRKTAEQLAALKGLKSSRHFAPSSTESVLHNMPSSAI